MKGGRAMVLGAALACVAWAVTAMGETRSLRQYTSGGHVLGFDSGGYFVSNGTYALCVRFEHAQAVAPTADDTEQSGSSGGKVAALTRVSYAGLWNGVSVTYDAGHGGIARSTWTLEPGADPAAIRLAYNRAVTVAEDGTLSVAFDAGSLSESRPVAWQEVDGRLQPVEVAFVRLAGDVVGFHVGAYRRDLPLTIDPTLTWNTFFGGTGGDTGGAIVLDGSGNIYVAGSSTTSWGSPVRPFTVGGYGDDQDAFAAKLTAGGALIWNTFLGGSGIDAGNAIAVDSSGNVYVVGSSGATWGSPLSAYTHGAFAAKLTADGAVAWNTFLGSSSADAGYAIATDGSGNVYVAGVSNAAWGSPKRPFEYSWDAFAAKLSANGDLAWNTFLAGGGASTNGGSCITVDSSGNVYVTGMSNGSWGSPLHAFTGPSDGFAAKLAPGGALTWNTFLGGSGYDNVSGCSVAVDGSGNVYVAGSSSSAWGSPLRGYTSGSDAFAAKLAADGGLVWNTFLGGSGTDGGGAIALDGRGNIYISGASDATWGSPVHAYIGGTDAFVVAIPDVAPSVCGNGIVEGSEQCDDGNAADGDGCSAACQVEPCYTCPDPGQACMPAGSGTACNDNNPCTDDACDGGGHCVSSNNTAPCDDGQFCNGTDTCSGGTCVHSGNPCAGGGECNNSCNEAARSCAVAAGMPCTGDGNVCTTDQCDGFGACIHSPNTAPCDDGVFCNGADHCAGGSCSVHSGDPCAARPQCATSCDESAKSCFSAAGTACDDGDACTQSDACDGTGHCSGSNPVVCTPSDLCHLVGRCDSATGLCSNPPVVCDDHDPCTADTCDVGDGQCHHTNLPPGTACDDGDPATMHDQCNDAGGCSGTPAPIQNYALLTWPDTSTATAMFGREDRIIGHICAHDVRLRQNMVVDGDVVATTETGTAVRGMFFGDHLTHDLLSCGGAISLLGRNRGKVDGQTAVWDQSPPPPAAMSDCEAAAVRADTRQKDFLGLAATAPPLGAVRVRMRDDQLVAAGSGVVILDADSLTVGAGGTLTVAGSADTDHVILRIDGRCSLQHQARIVVQGLRPEQVIFVVNGPVVLSERTSVTGTILAADIVRIGRNSMLDGQVLGRKRISLGQSVDITRQAFKGW